MNDRLVRSDTGHDVDAVRNYNERKTTSFYHTVII